jgi:hypothetical protein
MQTPDSLQTALLLLDPCQPQPLPARLDAAAWLEAAIADAQPAGLAFEAEICPLLHVLVPALLGSIDEELSDALVRLIQTLLLAAPSRACAHVLTLTEAALETPHHQYIRDPFALPTCLALALDAELVPAGATAAANALPERRQLVAAILSGIEGGESAQSQPIFLRILLRVLRAHGASAASVLARCDVPITRLLALLPTSAGAVRAAPAGSARAPPSVE